MPSHSLLIARLPQMSRRIIFALEHTNLTRAQLGYPSTISLDDLTKRGIIEQRGEQTNPAAVYSLTPHGRTLLADEQRRLDFAQRSSVKALEALFALPSAANR